MEDGENEDSEKPRDEKHDFEKVDEMWIDGKKEQTGNLNRKSPDEVAALRGGHGEGGVESCSGLGHEALTDKNEQRRFV